MSSFVPSAAACATPVVLRPRRGRRLRARVWTSATRDRAAAIEVDHLVGRALDLGDGHRRARLAVGWIRECLASQAHDGGDQVRALTGHAIRHEPAVRVADDRDPLRVDGELALDLGDDARQVGDVVDGRAGEVAAGIGRVPEPVPVAVLRSVGRGVDEAGLLAAAARPNQRSISSPELVYPCRTISSGAGRLAS